MPEFDWDEINQPKPLEPRKLAHMLAAWKCLTEEEQTRWTEIVSTLTTVQLREWMDIAMEMSIPEVIQGLKMRIKVERRMTK